MAKIDPVTSITTGKELASEMDDALAQSLTNSPSLGGIDDSSLLNYLPKVGPPENRLVIPKLGLNVPIVIPPIDALLKEDWTKLEEEIQTGLQDGVVHYPGTAQPGQAGNFFVTGHSSYFPWAPGKFKSVFARLGELDVGDEYWVFYGGDKFRYVVDGKKEINPNDVTALDQPINKRISSLMTCTPVGTTLRRLIISAQELDPATGKPMEVGEHQTEQALPKMNLQMLPI
jgi:LPXTG-site transpeptidase (sortase) family protein